MITALVALVLGVALASDAHAGHATDDRDREVTLRSTRTNPVESYRAWLTSDDGKAALTRCYFNGLVGGERTQRVISFAAEDCIRVRGLERVGVRVGDEVRKGDLLAVLAVTADDGTMSVPSPWPVTEMKLVWPRTLSDAELSRFLVKSPRAHLLVARFLASARAHPVQVTPDSAEPLRERDAIFVRRTDDVSEVLYAIARPLEGVQGEVRRYQDAHGLVLDLGTADGPTTIDPEGWPHFLDEAADFAAVERAFRDFLVVEGWRAVPASERTPAHKKARIEKGALVFTRDGVRVDVAAPGAEGAAACNQRARVTREWFTSDFVIATVETSVVGPDSCMTKGVDVFVDLRESNVREPTARATVNGAPAVVTRGTTVGQ